MRRLATRSCVKCSCALPNRLAVDGQVKNISHRKYCLDCSPFGSHNTKKLHIVTKTYCTHCGEVRTDQFYASQYTMCKACNKKYLVEKMRRNKKRIIEYLGGKCQICGYDQFDCSLEIHHMDPSTKSRTSNKVRSWRWDRIEREIQNCILLCSNCHQAVEAGYLSVVQSISDVRA